MTMGRRERFSYPENSVVISFGFCIKMRDPRSLWGGKGRARITVYICWKFARFRV